MITKKYMKKAVLFVLATCVSAGITAGASAQAAKAASTAEKLNTKVTKIVDKNVKADDSAKKKLKKLFSYVEKKYDYSRKIGFEPYSGWEKDYALEMLEDGKGSCYHYADAYAFLAKKATGVSVRIGTGQTNGFSGSLQKHAWTEVKLNGKWYVCDTNLDKYGADSSKKYFFKKRNSLKSTYNQFKDAKYYDAV